MAFNKYLSLLILILAGIATAQPVTGPPKLCENNSKQCAKRHGVCIKDCRKHQGTDQKCTRKCDKTDYECQCLICKQKAPDCTEKGGRCVPFCKEDDAFMQKVYAVAKQNKEFVVQPQARLLSFLF